MKHKAYGPVCFKCDRSAEPEEDMFTIYISLTRFKSDSPSCVINEHALSQICFGCAAGMLNEAAISQKLIIPGPLHEEIAERGIEEIE